MLHLFIGIVILLALIAGHALFWERRQKRRRKADGVQRRRRHRAVEWAWDWLHARPSQKRLAYKPEETQDR